MVDEEKRRLILAHHHRDKWHIGTIAKQLSLHHSTVRRVIAGEGMPESTRTRTRVVDQYVPFIKATLEQYPGLTSARLYEMLSQRGYTGCQSTLRHFVATLRPNLRRPEAFLRLKVFKGDQAQVDWAHCGTIPCGKAQRKLYAFVMVLSFSRAIFCRFYLGLELSFFLQGHAEAFEWFNGIPRRLLYDNLRSVVLSRIGSSVVYNEEFTKFAAHYRFDFTPVAVARGNEKGRVERAIRYIRDNFLAGRRYSSLEDLNEQVSTWCNTTALNRKWQDDATLTVREVFEDEKQSLIALPVNSYPCAQRVAATIGKSPYVRFDTNDYSVPHTAVGKTVTVLATSSAVTIIDGTETLAVHPRCYDRRKLIENQAHINDLKSQKRQAQQGSKLATLLNELPLATTLLEEASARRYCQHTIVRQTFELLSLYGSQELHSAMQEAHASNSLYLQAIRLILETKRAKRGALPAMPAVLPPDPRLNLSVTMTPLSAYSSLIDTAQQKSNVGDPDEDNS